MWVGNEIVHGIRYTFIISRTFARGRYSLIVSMGATTGGSGVRTLPKFWKDPQLLRSF